MYHVLALSAALCITLVVIFIACFAKISVTFAACATMLIGSATVSAYGVFAWFALGRLRATAAGETDTMLESEGLLQIRRVAVLAATSATVPLVFFAIALCCVVYQLIDLVDWCRLESCRSFMFLVLVLASSLVNPEMLQLVPWCENGLQGYPSYNTVALSTLGSVIGDLLQLGTQSYFIFLLATDDFFLAGGVEQREMERRHQLLLSSTFGTSILCVALSAISLWSRGLRKCVLLGCKGKTALPHNDEPFWVQVSSNNFSAAAASAAYSASSRVFALEASTIDATAPQVDARANFSLRTPPETSPTATRAHLQRPAPRDTAMRWLSEVEEDSPVKRPHSPLASHHPGGVAVDGEIALLFSPGEVP